MEATIPYEPPQEYEDFPFLWIYDASGLTNGNNYQNQFVYIEGGWGDFIMRRAVGFKGVLNPADGTFQLRDSQKRNMSSEPLYVGGAGANDDYAFPNEVPYPETTIIQFDLFDILKA